MVLKGKITSSNLKARERVLGEMQLPFAHLRTVTIGEIGPAIDTGFAKGAIILSEEGMGQKAGSIVEAGASDTYGFVAPKNGKMTIRLSQANGTSWDPHVYIYDSKKTLIGQDDDGGGNLNSRIQFQVVAGTIYYVKAAIHSQGAMGGDYELLLNMNE